MLSLYRRHRPKTFDEVVGQEHIVRTLLAGTSLDVVEMDAASNNSVDDIRELRENVALAPMQGGRRIYILDEAHMLSASAWNAFLKTLEQLVTYGGKEVKLENVLDILGVADAELVLEAAEALADRDPRAALLGVQRLSDSGRDFTQFMRDLSAHLRHLFVVQTLGEVPDSFSVTAEQTDRLAQQAERLSQGEILRAIDFLATAIAAVKDGSEPRIQLEMALLKATQPQADLSLQAL